MNNTTLKENTSFSIDILRNSFPILHQEVNGCPLIYFDNAATTQKPNVVTQAIENYYNNINANIHRAVHTLAEKATQHFEDARKKVQKFINAKETEEIIFTKGTTDSINLVASTFGRQTIKEGDEILISTMEHHSNIVPWQMLCEEKSAVLKVIPINETGEISLEAFEKLISSKTKLVAIVHASNSLGTINPIKKIIDVAHSVNAKVLIDGAQASAHLEIDMQDLNCDFYALSAHKMYGPTGVGILYGKRELLEGMPPYQGGGEMIKEVSFSKTTYNDIPYKFEAGTPNIADAIALGTAVTFIENIKKQNITAHESTLLEYLTQQLETIPTIKIFGKAQHKVGIVSFLIEGFHHFDIGMLLDARGIAVRTGHHCTQPLMNFYGIDGTIRVSLALYNTKEEIDYLVESIERIIHKKIYKP